MVKRDKSSVLFKKSNTNNNKDNVGNKDTKIMNKQSGTIKVKPQADLLNKDKVKVTSKLKRKLKLTQKKLELEDSKLINCINAIKTENEEMNKKGEVINYNNLYMHVFLINQNKVNDNTGADDLFRQLKNKLIKLPVPTINDNNELKVLLVDDNLLKKKPKQNSSTNTNIKSEDDVDSSNDQILNKLGLDEKVENYLEVMNTSQFLTLLKSNLSNLPYQYHSILLSDTLRTRVTQILRSKNNKILPSSLVYYNKNKFGKKIFEYLKKLIPVLLNASPLIINKNKHSVIKAGNTSMSSKDLFKNIKTLLYKVVSLLLSASEKYTTVKSVLVKSESSLPYEVVNKMTGDELDLLD